MLNKIELILKVLDGPIGQKFVSQIPDDSVYTILYNIFSLFIRDEEKSMNIIKILDSVKGNVSLSQILTDKELISAVRDLLHEFNNEQGVKNEKSYQDI